MIDSVRWAESFELVTNPLWLRRTCGNMKAMQFDVDAPRGVWPAELCLWTGGGPSEYSFDGCFDLCALAKGEPAPMLLPTGVEPRGVRRNVFDRHSVLPFSEAGFVGLPLVQGLPRFVPSVVQMLFHIAEVRRLVLLARGQQPLVTTALRAAFTVLERKRRDGRAASPALTAALEHAPQQLGEFVGWVLARLPVASGLFCVVSVCDGTLAEWDVRRHPVGLLEVSPDVQMPVAMSGAAKPIAVVTCDGESFSVCARTRAGGCWVTFRDEVVVDACGPDYAGAVLVAYAPATALHRLLDRPVIGLLDGRLPMLVTDVVECFWPADLDLKARLVDGFLNAPRMVTVDLSQPALGQIGAAVGEWIDAGGRACGPVARKAAKLESRRIYCGAAVVVGKPIERIWAVGYYRGFTVPFRFIGLFVGGPDEIERAVAGRAGGTVANVWSTDSDFAALTPGACSNLAWRVFEIEGGSAPDVPALPAPIRCCPAMPLGDEQMLDFHRRARERVMVNVTSAMAVAEWVVPVRGSSAELQPIVQDAGFVYVRGDGSWSRVGVEEMDNDRRCFPNICCFSAAKVVVDASVRTGHVVDRFVFAFDPGADRRSVFADFEATARKVARDSAGLIAVFEVDPRSFEVNQLDGSTAFRDDALYVAEAAPNGEDFAATGLGWVHGVMDLADPLALWSTPLCWDDVDYEDLIPRFGRRMELRGSELPLFVPNERGTLPRLEEGPDPLPPIRAGLLFLAVDGL
jgi:hypothetical protein